MENLKEQLRNEKKELANSGQIYFDSHGIYIMVSSTLEKMPLEKYYLEKFQEKKLRKPMYEFDKQSKKNINWGFIAILFVAAAIWTVILLALFGIY